MIGIFDSGLGGLTIYKEITKKLPEYQYIYLGDTARTPYGNRSEEVIYKFTEEAVDFLFKKGCELVIIACNTASAEALRKIQQEYLPAKYPDKKVLGVIRPLVEEAAVKTKFGRIGVIGTRATVNSGSYERELNKLKDGLKISSVACPLLVPLIEEGWLKRKETQMILRYYLRPLKHQKIDTLILGCTHYPFLVKAIKGIMGKKCQVLDSGQVVADKLADYLHRHKEVADRLKKGDSARFFVTDKNGKFLPIAEKFLGREIEVEAVKL